MLPKKLKSLPTSYFVPCHDSWPRPCEKFEEALPRDVEADAGVAGSPRRRPGCRRARPSRSRTGGCAASTMRLRIEAHFAERPHAGEAGAVVEGRVHLRSRRRSARPGCDAEPAAGRVAVGRLRGVAAEVGVVAIAGARRQERRRQRLRGRRPQRHVAAGDEVVPAGVLRVGEDAADIVGSPQRVRRAADRVHLVRARRTARRRS